MHLVRRSDRSWDPNFRYCSFAVYFAQFAFGVTCGIVRAVCGRIVALSRLIFNQGLAQSGMYNGFALMHRKNQ